MAGVPPLGVVSVWLDVVPPLTVPPLAPPTVPPVVPLIGLLEPPVGRVLLVPPLLLLALLETPLAPAPPDRLLLDEPPDREVVLPAFELSPPVAPAPEPALEDEATLELLVEDPPPPPVELPLPEPLLPASPEEPEGSSMGEVHAGPTASKAASRPGKYRVESGSPVRMKSSEGKWLCSL